MVNNMEPLPPWERDEFLLSEAPIVILKLWGIHVRLSTVRQWEKRGLLAVGGQTRATLVTVSRAGRRSVRMADLKAFMEAT